MSPICDRDGVIQLMMPLGAENLRFGVPREYFWGDSRGGVEGVSCGIVKKMQNGAAVSVAEASHPGKPAQQMGKKCRRAMRKSTTEEMGWARGSKMEGSSSANGAANPGRHYHSTSWTRAGATH